MAKEEKPVEYMQTGCDLIDLLIGGNKGVYGIPYGYIINLIGDKSAGKSFLKNEILAYNYYKYKDRFRWLSDDSESGDTFDTQRLYGVKLQSSGHHLGKVEFDHSNTVEELDAHVSLFMETLGEENRAIYAVDSLDGLSDANDEDEADLRVNLLKTGKEVKDKGSFAMGKQKFLSKFFRTQEKKLMDKHASMLIVSQIRDNVGSMGYGPSWTVSGGKALEFYSHTRVFLKTKMKIMVGDRCIGAVVEASTIKSKTPRPFRKVTYTVYFDRGIDNIGSNIDYLYDLRGQSGELLKASEAISWGDHKVTIDSVKEWLESTGKMDAYKEYARKELGQARINTEVAAKWAKENCPEEWSSYFGKIMSRDELRQLCETDKEARKLLRDKVRAKWEATEDAACSAIGFTKSFDLD